MKQRAFLYALRPPMAGHVFVAEGDDLEALQALAESRGLQGVRIMLPDDNRRETADWFIANTAPPSD